MAEVLALPLEGMGHGTVVDRGPELISALQVERKLVGDMVQVLRRQRTAVADDDIAAIDDTVFSAQRVLLNLSQARTRRQTLLHFMTGLDDVAMGDFEVALGPLATPVLLQARDALREEAQHMSRELDMNRRLLSGAIDAGDQMIRTLTGNPKETPSYAPPSGAAEEATGSSGVLIDRQV